MVPSFAGCLEPEDKRTIIEEPGIFDFNREIPETTWYHYAGGINALDNLAVEKANITANLAFNNIPFWTQGSYYGIGMTTFEPTMGITTNDNLYMTSWGNGPAGSTAIVQCTGLIEMKNLSDYNCANVYDPISPVPNSNDPYVYVDKWTDRIMKFDMHALAGMTVEWSDNDGASWSLPTFATSYSVQDHQTIGSSPYPAFNHPTTWVFCVNGNWEAPLCSTSFDGGLTWSPEVPGAPLGCNSGGLSAHIEGADNGNFYRGNVGCSGSGYSIYRSTDGGFTWTEHPLP
ncbi:MAG: sialidase family protein, partial [Candidatus Poseidoniaceae archaeon]|nr:sialidase family protein [Candidatus Poseidoniaceae archaeon]